MDAFQTISDVSLDLEKKYNGRKKFVTGREILLHVQSHLFHQVSGEKANNPDIEGGYYGLNYQRARQTVANCIQIIECEENTEATKEGKTQPFAISWKY